MTSYDMYQLVRKMLDDFNEDLANNQQIYSSRLNKFLNITEEMVKPKPKKLTLEELLNIVIKKHDIEEDFFNDEEEWNFDF
ncbi:MAG: hypothetical protein ACI37Q_05415 [Candidatus Gastranaerophilaceae bacterium]